MMKYLMEVLEGLWSLLVGMAVTIRYFFKKPVTVIYPKERIAIKRFKGPISFVVSEKTNDHLCIACNACIKTCPSRCMSLQVGKSAVDGKRVLTDFKVNYMLCSLCSLCIDVCPTDALKHADEDYDIVSLAQKELNMDLLEPFEKRGTPLTRIPLAVAAASPTPGAPTA
jgi:formate hydrogenlyase subunit 6/NADH:ubiquinone oxidoreductase subunit I